MPWIKKLEVIILLRSCSYCNRFHDTKETCSNKSKRIESEQTERNNKFYKTYRWQKLSNEKRREVNYRCEICRALGKLEGVDEVHHILSINERWDMRLDYTNLLAVCASCHDVIHKQNLNSKHKIKKYFSIRIAAIES